MTTLHFGKSSIVGACLIVLWAAAACTPLRNLDATADGFANGEGGWSSPAAGGRAGTIGAAGHFGGSPSAGASGSVGVSGQGGSASSSAGGGMAQGGSAGLSNSETAGTTANQAGAPTAGAPPDDPKPVTFNLDMPTDMVNAPIQGDVSYVEATYSGEPSYQIATPTALYTVLRQTGNVISIVDQLERTKPMQWIGYSSYRPLRGAGIVSAEQPVVSTLVDPGSVTARHVRFHCQSAAGDWHWDWDFYVTQATLTITLAPRPFGFSYRGTPGMNLDDGDQLVLSSGRTQSAKDSYAAALVGPAGWAYVTDSGLGHSLFLIQHEQDAVVDRYDSLDGDSAALVLGAGQLTQLPLRFSLGLVGSNNYPAVVTRAQFVIDAVP